jgi:hypothetical protein
MRAGPSKSLISKKCLPFDFNVEVEVVEVEVVKYLCSKIQNHKLKFLMVSFEAFNLLIQEMYDVKRVEQVPSTHNERRRGQRPGHNDK